MTREVDIEAWVARGRPDLLPDWHPFDLERAYETFHRAVLRHARVHPQLALRALDLVERQALPAHLVPKVLRLRGGVASAMGDSTRANACYERAWDLSGDAPPEERVRVAVGWIFALGQAGELEAVRAISRRVRPLLSRVPANLRARLQANLGSVEYMGGHHDRARRAFAKARETFLQIGHEADAALTAYNLAQVEAEVGRIDLARRLLAEAAAVFTSRGHESQALTARYLELSLDLDEGKLDPLDARFDRLSERHRELGTHQVRAGLLRQRASHLLAMGAPALACLWAQEAYRSSASTSYHRDAARALHLWGRALLDCGRHEEAERHLARAEGWFRANDAPALADHAQVDLLTAHLRQDRTRGVSEELNRLSRRARYRDDRSLQMKARLLAADLALRTGRSSRALRTLGELRRTARSARFRHLLPRLAAMTARSHLHRGDGAAARRWAQKAAREVLGQQQALGTAGARGLAASGQLAFDREIVGILDAGGGSHRTVVDWICRLRLPSEILEDAAVGSEARRRELAATLIRLRRSLDELDLEGTVIPRRDRLEQELERCERRIASRPAVAASRLQAAWQSARLASWRTRLGRRVLVTIERVGDQWQGFVVPARGTVQRMPLPDLASALGEHATELALSVGVAARMPATVRASYLHARADRALARLHALSQAIFAPLEVEDDRELLLFVPPELSGLPLEALAELHQPGRAAQRIRHPLLLRPHRHLRGEVLLVHDGQPDRRAEAQAIATVWRSAQRRVRVASRWPRKIDAPLSVLHVAAHGSHAEDRPLLNAIRLGRQWIGQESLDALRLDGAVVCLASCRSGLDAGGERVERESWSIRALRGGAAGVVSALWDVDDAQATRFSRSFHTALAAGENVARARALAAAELRALEPHPFAWAGWAVTGR